MYRRCAVKVSLFLSINFVGKIFNFPQDESLPNGKPTVEIVVELHPNVKYATPAPSPRMKNIKAQWALA
jgi:hypothetical protein